jgi:hypothetical protein
MTGAMTAFAIAVGSTLLVYDLLMTRPKHRRAKRSSHDSPASDAGNDGEGWAPTGLAASLPRTTLRAIRATPAVAEAGVISAPHPRKKARRFDQAPSSFLDSFQSASGSLESLEKTLFLFASRHHVEYR